METFPRVSSFFALTILIVLWGYFFIDSYRHKSGWPWGYLIIFVGIFVARSTFTFRSNDIIFLSIDSMLVIVLLGLLVNIIDIQKQMNIIDVKNFFLFSGIGFLFGLLFGLSFMAEKITNYLQGAADYTPFALAFGSVQKSIAEEFLFRGYLLSYLRKYRFNIFFAITLQALIFTSLHTSIYSNNWNLLALVFLVGIVGGVLTWKSGSLIPASVLHIIVNLFAVAWRLFGGIGQ